MTHHHEEAHPTTHDPWTIARIQKTLTRPAVVHRFLTDISHAPEHRVKEVFTTWRRIAAVIEARTRTPMNLSPFEPDSPHSETSTEGTNRDDHTNHPTGSRHDTP
ncbi:hypothetical protein AB0399_09960 [Streptomyces sp. NPDC088194]|uniref:hypothetical protein n=1 Tax=Streptomyces sp. NPDC088194 TaxID=3154931 RepID=UPI00344EA57E